MIKTYPNEHIDVCLITTSEISLGVRALSSFLKEKGYTVALGFFDSWGLYTDGELAGIRDWVRALDPKVIGISAIEFTREKAVQLMTALAGTGRPVVAGGADATLNPGVYLGHASYVIRGEGEEAFAELVEALLNGKGTEGVRNLCWKDGGGTVRVNPVRPLIRELDTLPFEDWLDIEHHFRLAGGKAARKTDFALQHKGRYVDLFTIRGCAFSCSFCAGSRIKELYPSGPPVRKRAVARVIERVEQLHRHGPPLNAVYFFEDDLFLRTPGEMRQFAAAWKQRIDLPFCANATPLTVSDEKLRVLVDAGLDTVCIGVQTGSERVNFEVYRRRIDNGTVLRAAGIVRKHLGKGRFGLTAPKYDFIVNNPFESRRDLLETVSLFRRLPKPYYANVISLVMFEGTALQAKAVSAGFLKGKDEAAKYNLHDLPRHSRVLVQRGGEVYLNSLLYWMSGYHTKWRYGVIPAPAVGLLTSGAAIRFLNARPRLVSFLNRVMPTHIRLHNLKMRMIKYMSERMGKMVS